MITSEHLLVRAEVEVDGSRETIDLAVLSILPKAGEVMKLDYWHGRKLIFLVEEVQHHISNIGQDMLQQITLRGKEV